MTSGTSSGSFLGARRLASPDGIEGSRAGGLFVAFCCLGEGAQFGQGLVILGSEHQDAIAAFNNTRRDFARLLRERSMRLGEVLADRIAEARLEITSEAHSGARSRLGADFWNAYTFAREDWSVELKLSDRSDRPSLIYVQDYEGQIGGTYKHRREEPLGLGWTASDSEIADAFIERVKVILQQVRDVDRPG